jgi:hypothetical protein
MCAKQVQDMVCVCLSAGNGGSLDKCRRRWDLADAEHLKYKFMQVGTPSPFGLISDG